MPNPRQSTNSGADFFNQNSPRAEFGAARLESIHLTNSHIDNERHTLGKIRLYYVDMMISHDNPQAVVLLKIECHPKPP